MGLGGGTGVGGGGAARGGELGVGARFRERGWAGRRAGRAGAVGFVLSSLVGFVIRIRILMHPA